ncbi:hypothetical protein [Sphingobacterium sp. LRF_L2]|uniref:hypothetical protein n=1 Tax=Sphingobacterium sp. LRF_L2 TaxID=3369421 RepID=UPI003F60A4C2
MKLLYFLLFFTCQDSARLNELKTINSEITNMVIRPVFESVQSYSKADSDVLILNIIQHGENIEVRISMFDKADFGSCFKGRDDKVFGFTKYQNIPVIVFGNAAKEIYRVTENSEIFTFLNVSKTNVKSIEKNDIPAPPVSFEPMVWVYSFDNVDGFRLKEADLALPIFLEDN